MIAAFVLSFFATLEASVSAWLYLVPPLSQISVEREYAAEALRRA